MRTRTYWKLLAVTGCTAMVFNTVVMVGFMLNDKPYADSRTAALLWLVIAVISTGKLMEGNGDDR